MNVRVCVFVFICACVCTCICLILHISEYVGVHGCSGVCARMCARAPRVLMFICVCVRMRACALFVI